MQVPSMLVGKTQAVGHQGVCPAFIHRWVHGIWALAFALYHVSLSFWENEAPLRNVTIQASILPTKWIQSAPTSLHIPAACQSAREPEDIYSPHFGFSDHNKSEVYQDEFLPRLSKSLQTPFSTRFLLVCATASLVAKTNCWLRQRTHNTVSAK